MTAETNDTGDPRRIEAFRALRKIMDHAKQIGSKDTDAFNLSIAALQEIGYSGEDTAILLNQFLASEISSSMRGAYTELPDLITLPKESWERKRIASFTWWYAEYVSKDRVAEWSRELQLYHPHKRAAFELGNSDTETDELLKWANEYPERIASIFAEGIIGGELGTYHIETLARFVKKAAEGTLVNLVVTDENFYQSME